MKITLPVNGQERTFSESELIAILEDYFELGVPIEGKWFKVDPAKIDRRLFSKKRPDSQQEKIRKFIKEAFKEVESNPEMYADPFEIMVPEKTWEGRATGGKFEKIASSFCGHIADKIEFYLGVAQRIANGETWEHLCNARDTANWYRVITWKKGYLRYVGDSRMNRDCYSCVKSPAEVWLGFDFEYAGDFSKAVPLIARKLQVDKTQEIN